MTENIRDYIIPIYIPLVFINSLLVSIISLEFAGVLYSHVLPIMFSIFFIFYLLKLSGKFSNRIEEEIDYYKKYKTLKTLTISRNIMSYGLSSFSNSFSIFVYLLLWYILITFFTVVFPTVIYIFLYTSSESLLVSYLSHSLFVPVSSLIFVVIFNHIFVEKTDLYISEDGTIYTVLYTERIKIDTNSIRKCESKDRNIISSIHIKTESGEEYVFYTPKPEELKKSIISHRI